MKRLLLIASVLAATLSANSRPAFSSLVACGPPVAHDVSAELHRASIAVWSTTAAECFDAPSGLPSGANFAQKTFSESFSQSGKFAGKTVDDVAAALRSGAVKPHNVPVEYINRGGNTLILNTRSAQALERAGIPRSQWNAINVTDDAAAQARLTGQLQRNNLPSQGTPTVRSSGGN